MIPKEFLDLILAVLIPVAGAVGYVHGVFATNNRVDSLEVVVHRVDAVLCEIAINDKLKDAVKICTKK